MLRYVVWPEEYATGTTKSRQHRLLHAVAQESLLAQQYAGQQRRRVALGVALGVALDEVAGMTENLEGDENEMTERECSVDETRTTPSGQAHN